MSAALWHDVECAGYDADLPAWRRLAADARRPAARRWLRHRARGTRPRGARARRHRTRLRARAGAGAARPSGRARICEIDAVAADARNFDLGRRFALVIAPMQVVQLLGGRDGRAAFMRCAVEPPRQRAACSPLTLADPYEGEQPEVAVDAAARRARAARAGSTRARPSTVRTDAEGVTVERVREAAAPDGEVTRSGYSITLDLVSPRELEAEAREAGFRKRPRDPRADATELYVGTDVVVLVRPMSTLRVCSLYPDLMNIYADRGNIAVLRARCEWRGIGFELAGASLGRALRPRRARPLLHGRRAGPRPARGGARHGRDEARRATRRRRPRRGGARRVRRLPAARRELRARGRVAARRRASSTCGRCARRARA